MKHETVTLNGVHIEVMPLKKLPVHQRYVAVTTVNRMAKCAAHGDIEGLEDMMTDLVQLCVGDYMSIETFNELSVDQKTLVLEAMFEGLDTSNTCQ